MTNATSRTPSRLLSEIQSARQELVNAKAATSAIEKRVVASEELFKVYQQKRDQAALPADAPAEVPRSSSVLRTKNPSVNSRSPDSFRRFGDVSVVLSSDGRSIHISGQKSDDDSTIRTLPPIKGEDRELLGLNPPWIFVADRSANPKFVANPRLGGEGGMQTELQRRPIVATVIAAFNFSDSRWIAEDLPALSLFHGFRFNPAKIPTPTQVFRFGSRLYAFSPHSARWGILDVDGLSDQLGLQPLDGEPPMVVWGNGYYAFNRYKGEWQDLSRQAELKKSDAPPAASQPGIPKSAGH